MKNVTTLLLAVTVIVSAWAVSGERAWARGRFHGHVGIYFGSPWVWEPYPYYPPVMYTPPVPVVVQPSPQVYVQRSTAYWYYCAGAGAYYPYVQSCPTGWMEVVPQQRPMQ